MISTGIYEYRANTPEMIGMAMLMTCRVEKYEKILAKETYIKEKRPIKETYVYEKKTVNIPEMVSASEIDELPFYVDIAKETYINEKRPIKETYVYKKKPLKETYIKYKKRVHIPEMVSASKIDELPFCVDIGCCHHCPTTYEYVYV